MDTPADAPTSSLKELDQVQDLDLDMDELANSPLPTTPTKTQPIRAINQTRATTALLGTTDRNQPTSSIFDESRTSHVLPTKKRQNPFVFSSPMSIRPAKRATSPQDSSTAQEKIQQARQLLIEAASLLGSNNKEQTRVLDLLEIFRDYVEKKAIPTAAKIIATQVANLEATSKKMAIQSQKATFAQALRQPSQQANDNGTTPKGGWTVVGKRNSNPSQVLGPRDPNQVLGPRDPRSKVELPIQLVLAPTVRDTSEDPNFAPIVLRDKINEAYKTQGNTALTALSIRKSVKGNIILTLTTPTARLRVLGDLSRLASIVPFASILEDNTWHKVVIHGVSTEEFNTPNGLARVCEEIKTFNKGLQVVGTPIWLTNAEKRASQEGASILVAFATEDEATQAIRNRLYIGGVSVRAEKARDKPRHTQAHNTKTKDSTA